jgi:hypothetical protein
MKASTPTLPPPDTTMRICLRAAVGQFRVATKRRWPALPSARLTVVKSDPSM